MKPYRESQTLEAVLDAPIDRVWALRANPEEMCAAFSRMIAVEILDGEPGEKGCGYRLQMRTSRGRIQTVWAKVTDARPPRTVTVRSRIVQDMPVKRLRVVISESTRTFTRQGKSTATSVVVTTETLPVPWYVRALLSLTRKARERDTTAIFEAETVEENAYHARAAS